MSPSPILKKQVDALSVSVYRNNEEMGAAAAVEAAEVIRTAIRDRGQASLIIATGNSQLTFLEALRDMKEIDWSKVVIFHMDEYVDLPVDHPASFPLFLQRHFLDYIEPAAFYPVAAEAGKLETNCSDYAALLREHPADLCAMGIGENGHIAFNDPPFAEFDDPVWVKVVRLDDVSRQQQVGEGHFGGIDEVPTHAITLTIPALLSAKRALCIVPESRKADAVERALTGPITEACPASVLRRYASVHLILDPDSAASWREDQ